MKARERGPMMGAQAKILVVDDNQGDVMLLKKRLESCGYAVIVAHDGVEALEKAEAEHPDLIIADILMPMMDSYQTCRKLKANSKLQDLPFVFYTASCVEKQDQEFGLSPGATGFIIKPVEPDALAQIISDTLKEYREGRVAAPEVPAEEDAVYQREYSERLVKQLEDKILELEVENAERKKVMGELRQQKEFIDSLDITERNQAERELDRLYKQVNQCNVELEDRIVKATQLEEAKLSAEVANRAKSDFLASMSHELRTPLNAVIGFSQVLQEQYYGNLNEKQAEYVSDIIDSGEHLLSLINDILDLSRIEAGQVELELSKVKIDELLKDSLVIIRQNATSHGINLTIRIAENLKDMEIMADERRLKQVMFNLLSNAIKFSPDGGNIEVDATREGQEVIISVRDSGEGIAPSDLERVFQQFYQGTSSQRGKTPGTGLGLPLTRRMVEMHNGRIWAESEGLNKGSRFVFTLPVQKQRTPRKRAK